jgi:hypothetical protein
MSRLATTPRCAAAISAIMGRYQQPKRNADQRYARTLEDCLFETPDSAEAVLALVHFSGTLAADRLIGEVTQEPVNDERDA